MLTSDIFSGSGGWFLAVATCCHSHTSSQPGNDKRKWKRLHQRSQAIAMFSLFFSSWESSNKIFLQTFKTQKKGTCFKATKLRHVKFWIPKFGAFCLQAWNRRQWSSHTACPWRQWKKMAPRQAGPNGSKWNSFIQENSTSTQLQQDRAMAQGASSNLGLGWFRDVSAGIAPYSKAQMHSILPLQRHLAWFPDPYSQKDSKQISLDAQELVSLSLLQCLDFVWKALIH